MKPHAKVDLTAVVPGLDEARKGEERARLRAFLPAGMAKGTLLGCEVVDLTPRIALELAMAGNPCVAGKPGTREDMALFLWRLSPHFCRPGERWRWWVGKWHRRAIRRAVARAGYFAATLAIRAWMEEQTQDAPPTVTTEGAAEQEPAGFVGAAALVNWFAECYGWPADVILDKPLLLLWQSYRAHHAAHGSPLPSCAPSDRMVGRWFGEMQARVAAQGKEAANG